MCTQRKQIYNNGHRFYRNRYSPYVLSIPCGQCSECLQDKANEWELRTYYQYLECIEKGGYAIWDTLTYKDEEHPHLNTIEKHVPDKYNFKCFNRIDLQNFWKRLRTNLNERGIETKGAIKYLTAAEYGQDEDRTMRSHYHTIIYCNADITPVELSMEIKRAWKKGTTCGVEDKGYKYFWEKGVISSKASALRVAHYIGKYCMKNLEYDKVAEAKCKLLTQFWYSVEQQVELEKVGDNIYKKKEWRDRKNAILRKVKTFHMQSKGYGQHAIECDCINKEGTLIGMPNARKIYWWQKLPMYYIRKLYYDYERNGKQITWYLTETGKAWKQKNLQKTIEGYAKKLRENEEFYQSKEFKSWIRQYQREEGKEEDDNTWYRLNDLAFAYRNGRRWEDYAEYVIFHKGRIWDGTNYKPSKTIEMNAKAAIYANHETALQLYHNYVTPIDKEEFGRAIVSPRDLGSMHTQYKQTQGDELSPKEFAKRYCINETSRPEWDNFDALGDILDTINTYIEWQKSRSQRHKRVIEQLTSKGILKLC